MSQALREKAGKLGRQGNLEAKKMEKAGKLKSQENGKGEQAMKYICEVCGWEYDEEAGYPDGGIAPGTKWEDVPEDFECPLCNVGKDQFTKE